MIKVVIRDEAHRSLGDKTQEAMDDMHSYGEIDTEMLQEQDKDLLETDVLLSNEKLELLFTATPNLLDKSVRDTYEEIFGLRIQDLVEE
jgi:type I site-specific restriction-modification system R (restriction) subunit